MFMLLPQPSTLNNQQRPTTLTHQNIHSIDQRPRKTRNAAQLDQFVLNQRSSTEQCSVLHGPAIQFVLSVLIQWPGRNLSLLRL